MMEIRQIDLAWEAVNVLGNLSRKALDAIEQNGGRDPSLQRSTETAPSILFELREYGFDSIAGIIAKATGVLKQQPSRPSPAETLSLRALIQIFKEDRRGRYLRTAPKTRHNYYMQFQQIDREVGDLSLSLVMPNDILSWYERWSASGQHLCMGHTVVGKVRMLLRYGAATLQDKDCIRLNGALSAMRIKKGIPSVRRINARQADAVRMIAHKKKVPSIALAQAFMFDLKLGQKQVIGDWVPLSEPGDSKIIKKGKKWLPGLEWLQVDEDFILRLELGTEIKEFDLKRGCGMVMAELKRLREIPKEGPLIVRERKHLPYSAVQFRSEWRAVATAAGVPKSVQNVNYQTREPGKNIDIKDTKRDDLDEWRASVDKSKVWEFVSVLCKAIPEEIRDDVAQEMATDALCGKVGLDDLPGMKSNYVRRYHQGYDNRYAVRSLDEELPSGVRLGDTIRSDHEIWK
jgi:hypothetical protein